MYERYISGPIFRVASILHVTVAKNSKMLARMMSGYYAYNTRHVHRLMSSNAMPLLRCILQKPTERKNDLPSVCVLTTMRMPSLISDASHHYISIFGKI